MKIKLADVIINIESLHDAVLDMCKDYVVSDECAPDINVRTCQADIDYEREQSEEKGFSDEYLETLAVYRKIAESMIDRDTFLFHGSAIAIDGRGYILAAPSGTGKSTLARNLLSVLGPRMEYINDDKPLIHAGESFPLVYGTPWDGKHHLSSNKSVPLDGICIIERSTEPWVKEADAASVVQELLQQTYRPENAELMNKTLSLLDKVCKGIKIYKVGAVIDERSAQQLVATLTPTTIETELKQNGWIAYTNTGVSMMPLIEQDRDLMVIMDRPKQLHKYDVVLFKRTGGQLVLHRIVSVNNDGTYDLMGDNQRFIEQGVKDQQIIGVLKTVKKNVGTENEHEVSPQNPRYLNRVRLKLPLARLLALLRK